MKKVIIASLLCLLAKLSLAQPTNTESQSFLLKSLQIKGAHISHPEQIRSLSGLEEGKLITLPGYQISDAIKRIYKSEIFEDVRIQTDSISGKDIYLSIILKERSRISQVKVSGLKKAWKEDIEEQMGIVSGALFS
ncbi:MAG: hypothetical protein AAF696_34240, partial [Bacteroidota bacterium]